MSKNEDAENPWEYRDDLDEAAQKHLDDEEDRRWLEQRDKKTAAAEKSNSSAADPNKIKTGGSVSQAHKQFKADSMGYWFFLVLVAFFIYIFIDGCNR